NKKFFRGPGGGFSKKPPGKMEILYLNVLLASLMGLERFEYLSSSPLEVMWQMLPERLFARSAYGLPPLGKTPGYCRDEAMSISGGGQHHKMFYNSGECDMDEYLEMEGLCYALVEKVTAAVASLGYKIIGCSQREGQTNCSIALLAGVKRIQPDVITIIGGPNCGGEMARGIASLSESVDYIFSGESEVPFSNFLDSCAAGTLPAGRIIRGEPLADLDTIPVPDYTCFFEQTECFRGGEALNTVAASYESSRGCWWGAKRECNFCNERGAYRQKSAGKVLADLKHICERHRPRGIFMCDVVMPSDFHKEIFPRLLAEKDFPEIYYQAKANLTLQDMVELKKAKIDQFTVGIEALSDGLLKLMNKGVTVRQNLEVLRNARSIGAHVDWLLLWGFPGDRVEYYRETLKILPLLSHLQPPIILMHLYLVRFSQYLEKAKDYGIGNIRPWEVYNMIYPEWAESGNLAYWYAGDYPCEAHENPQLIEELAEEVKKWQASWQKTYLTMIPMGEHYAILDNRDIRGWKQDVMDYNKAREVMTAARYDKSANKQWALEEKLAVVANSWYIPLVTASPELLQKFQQQPNHPITAESNNK
ncbi:MAG: RiPP maturation radical SAM protein 1, partial [bacterium]|nr:RiPP maturation radical SAM protein 1 [bacterium]